MGPDRKVCWLANGRQRRGASPCPFLARPERVLRHGLRHGIASECRAGDHWNGIYLPDNRDKRCDGAELGNSDSQTQTESQSLRPLTRALLVAGKQDAARPLLKI